MPNLRSESRIDDATSQSVVRSCEGDLTEGGRRLHVADSAAQHAAAMLLRGDLAQSTILA